MSLFDFLGFSGGGNAVQKISAAQAKSIIGEGRPHVLLDVRTPEEFKQAHIKGAINIPVYEIKNRAEKELPDKNILTIVYCRSGGRSSGAARALCGMGYANVNDMGGIMSWPYDTVTD